MASKVFLFDHHNWLYCSDVSYDDDNTWHGHVVNGAWYLMYDTRLNGFFAFKDKSHANSLVAETTRKATLTWACDANLKNIGRLNYADMIADAQSRYENGEPANYAIEPEKVDEEYELYLKLRDKYDPHEDDIAF